MNLDDLRNLNLRNVGNWPVLPKVLALLAIFVVIVMLIFGGETLKPMVFSLFVGLVVGTYSSVYIASPILIEWSERLRAKELQRH